MERRIPHKERAVEALLNTKPVRMIAHRTPEHWKRRVMQILTGEPRLPLAIPLTSEIGSIQIKYLADDLPQWWSLSGKDDEHSTVSDVLEVLAHIENPRLLDIGANAGLYPLFAGKAGAYVDAIEPLPANVDVLKRNIVLNDLTENISIIPVAAGDKDGKVTFYLGKGGSMTGNLVDYDETGEGVSVESVRVDSMLKRGYIQPPDVVKIDVEGAEGKVIDGMRELLSSEQMPLHLFVEIHPEHIRKYGDHPEELKTRIALYGYTMQPCKVKDFNGVHMCHFVRSDK